MRVTTAAGARSAACRKCSRFLICSYRRARYWSLLNFRAVRFDETIFWQMAESAKAKVECDARHVCPLCKSRTIMLLRIAQTDRCNQCSFRCKGCGYEIGVKC